MILTIIFMVQVKAASVPARKTIFFTFSAGTVCIKKAGPSLTGARFLFINYYLLLL
jgi:hypothetical protein